MKIHAIQTGTVQVKINQQRGKGKGIMRLLNVLYGKAWSDPLPIYAWLIEHPEKLILVDTGETHRVHRPGYFADWHPYFRRAVKFEVKAEDEIDQQLTKLGFKAEDVDIVVLTHLHTDHAGGLHHFPQAAVYTTEAEYNQAKGFKGIINGYPSDRWPEWFTPTFIRPIEDHQAPFPKVEYLTKATDIMIVPTPGHTPHHVSVLAVTDDISYFIAGDTSYTQALFEEGVHDGVTANLTQADETFAAIKAYAALHATVYLPSHDPEAKQRLENNIVLSANA